ncbi:hypothetical protein [Marinobacter salarius]|uniref:hypothetical protein n=1 Tax=Marinobacter salarius TaxID=1420917 RepID=UPI000F85095D|nr:hypothetical protein [Marinobacter salarius]AZR42993.1 hypothetical protein MTMN5_03560 [Marinobacter salarius]
MVYYLSSEHFLNNLKRAAKAEKRSDAGEPLASYQDRIARTAGFQSWALFRNSLRKDGLKGMEERRLQLAQGLHRALPHTAHEYAIRDIEAFFRSNYEKCEDFSTPSNETENGYSHPSITVSEVVREVFTGVYPEKYLIQAIARIEERGPWCEDDSDILFE